MTANSDKAMGEELVLDWWECKLGAASMKICLEVPHTPQIRTAL